MPAPAPRSVDARIDDHAIQPGRERRISAESGDLTHQLQEHLLRYLACRIVIRMKEIERTRVDAVLVRFVQRSERFPVPAATRLEDLGAEVAAEGTPFRRSGTHTHPP